jgi:type IX secretion system PorP/SprF family membrane protein
MKALLLCLFCCCVSFSQAQETFFSQPFSTPTNISPAFVGAFNAKSRLVIQYRQPSAPNTEQRYGVSFDQKNVLPNGDYVGFGAHMGQQQASSLDKTIAKGAVAYGKYLGDMGNGSAHYLVAGSEIGFQQNTLSLSKLALAYGINLPNYSDGFLRNSFSDVSIGAMWFAAFKKGTRAHIGMVWQHLNKPNIGFLEPEILPFGYTVHTGCELPLAPQLKFVPTAIVTQQGATTDIKGGLSLKMTADDTISVQAGFFIRYDNKFTPKLTRQTLSLFFNLDFYQSTVRILYDASLGEIARNNGFEMAYIRFWGVPKHKSGRIPIF